MNIRVDLNTPIKDGTEVVFRSPVDCSQITGLIVYYNGESKEFAFADAHGNNVGDIDHLFAENVVVKVILDLSTSMAFVQNADTNAYLEGRFQELEKKIGKGGGGANILSPEQHLTSDMLVAHYEPSFYTSLSQAVADLNAGITDNADATANNAQCALYTDYEGNVCLTLLSDVVLGASITLNKTVVFKLNGYTIQYSGDYGITINGSNTVLSMQTPGSQLLKEVQNVLTATAMLSIKGSNSKLIGGNIIYTAANSQKTLCAIVPTNNAQIVHTSISVSLDSGDKQIMAIYPKDGAATITDSTISVNCTEGAALAISCTASSTDCVIDRCTINAEGRAAYGISSNSTAAASLRITECCINTTSTTGDSYGIHFSVDSVQHAHIEKCSINAGSPVNSCAGIRVTKQCTANILNSNIFTDGIHGGDETGSLPGQSSGIIIVGDVAIKECNVYGTHSAIQCLDSSRVTIDGGLYESVGHGGVYIANVDGQFYAQNATFRAVPYRGAYKAQYIYQNTDYINAAVYVGNVPGITGYMDNCILDGTGPCINGGMGAEPIRFKSGGTGNAIYASNCTFMGDGKIRFGGGNQVLYLGWANRMLCEATENGTVDTTTYAKKVFTGWEE